tara:strand:+ start:1223 stop:1729 length:507 start_codon:yes stop_codon:yes gene_type:complete
MMKKLLLTTALITGLVSTATAGEIVEVPISAITPNWSSVETRVPVQNCNQQLVPMRSNGSPIDIGNIFGGALGGLLGNQVGKGSGNVAATAAGAVGGWVLGGQLNKKPEHYQQQTVCTTSYRIEHKQFIQNYTVHYDFNGVRYQTRTTLPPQSNTLRLMVNTSHTVQR